MYLDPRHQEVNVLGGGALYRLLHLVSVRPVILKNQSINHLINYNLIKQSAIEKSINQLTTHLSSMNHPMVAHTLDPTIHQWIINQSSTVPDLVLWTGRHDRAAGLCAELRNGPVQHVDLREMQWGTPVIFWRYTTSENNIGPVPPHYLLFVLKAGCSSFNVYRGLYVLVLVMFLSATVLNKSRYYKWNLFKILSSTEIFIESKDFILYATKPF